VFLLGSSHLWSFPVRYCHMFVVTLPLIDVNLISHKCHLLLSLSPLQLCRVDILRLLPPSHYIQRESFIRYLQYCFILHVFVSWDNTLLCMMYIYIYLADGEEIVIYFESCWTNEIPIFTIVFAQFWSPPPTNVKCYLKSLFSISVICILR